MRILVSVGIRIVLFREYVFDDSSDVLVVLGTCELASHHRSISGREDQRIGMALRAEVIIVHLFDSFLSILVSASIVLLIVW